MSDNLKQHTARGFVWGLLNQTSMQLLNLVFGIVLARMLSAEDYGIVGVLAVFSMIASNLQQCGFVQGLINLRDPQHRDYNSVFWFNVGVSLCIYLILFFSAPLIAGFFHEPRLLWVSRLVFLGFFISSFGIVPGACMTRRLMVKEGTVISLVALLCSGATGIVLASAGYSYWSLAWQQLVFVGVSMVGRYIVVPFRPSLNITMQPVRRMFRFSVWLMLTTLVSSLSSQLLTFIFGRLLPMHQVGNYSQANKWNITATDTVRGAIAGIAQPVLAQVRDDDERSLRVLRKLMRYTSLVSFPALLGLALVSREFILVSIGVKWEQSAVLLALLAVGSSVMPLYALLGNVLISRARSLRYLAVSLLQVAGQLTLAVVFLGLSDASQTDVMRRLVLLFTVYNLLYLFVWHWAVRSLTPYSLPALLRDVMPYALAALATMFLVGFATDAMHITSQVLLLALRVLFAAIVYVALLALAQPAELKEAAAFLRGRK